MTALSRYRLSMAFFIVGLVISGVTAFPLVWELDLLSKLLGVGSAPGPEGHTGLIFWILTVKHGLAHTYSQYPWIGYGTDWLAFGHLIIATFFIGSWLHPLTARPNIHVGIFACIAIIPLALICGPIRGIPFYWQLIDCSFGLIGILPLLYCLRQIRHIEAEAASVSAHS